MRKRLSIRRQSIIIALASLFLVLAAVLMGVFEIVELKAIDVAFNLRGVAAPTSNVIIVAIDDESFTQTGLQWPWPRSYIAQVIDKLSDAKVKVIAIDIAFFQAAQGDQVLAESFRRAGNVILASTISIVSDPSFSIEQLNRPIEPLASSAAAIGLSNFPRDSDGFVRSMLGYQIASSQVQYSWPLYAAARYLGQPMPTNASPSILTLGNRTVPLDDQYLIINFRGPSRTIKNVPAYQVVNGDAKPELFKDKIVLIGATSEILHDSYPTPFKGNSAPMPGVEIVANTIETILSGAFLTRWGTLSTLTITLIAGLIGLALNFIRRPLLSLGILVVLGFMLAVVWYAAFELARVEIPLIAPESALLLTFVAPTVERAVAEEAEKRRVRGIFERFISPQMVGQIVEQGIEASRGKRAELTILFSDIRNFTTISENLAPDELVGILNEYLDVMTEVIFRNNGTVDKFEGDAIIAFWGAPSANPEHARHALRAALEMRLELAALRDKWTRGDSQKKFEIGIGLNSGDVFVGLIGSTKRVNYTIIGDNANLAARLQDLTKEFQWPILISESTYIQVKDEFDAEFAEARLVKGKTVPVSIYRVLGKKGAPENERVRALYA